MNTDFANRVKSKKAAGNSKKAKSNKHLKTNEKTGNNREIRPVSGQCPRYRECIADSPQFPVFCFSAKNRFCRCCYYRHLELSG